MVPAIVNDWSPSKRASVKGSIDRLGTSSGGGSFSRWRINETRRRIACAEGIDCQFLFEDVLLEVGELDLQCPDRPGLLRLPREFCREKVKESVPYSGD